MSEYTFNALRKVAWINDLDDLGDEVNAASSDGSTPMFVAALKDHADAMKALCTLWADVNNSKNDDCMAAQKVIWMSSRRCLLMELVSILQTSMALLLSLWQHIKVATRSSRCCIG